MASATARQFPALLLMALLWLGGGQAFAEEPKVSPDCVFRGISLQGKVQVVTSFPDLKIQKVSSFPDLKVQWVENFPDRCGKWQKVNFFPDFKIQYVESFPDLKIQTVSSFPGQP